MHLLSGKIVQAFKVDGKKIRYTHHSRRGNGTLAELECGHYASAHLNKISKGSTCGWCTKAYKEGKLTLPNNPKVIRTVSPPKDTKPRDSQLLEDMIQVMRGLSNRLTALEDAVTKPQTRMAQAFIPPVAVPSNGVDHKATP